MPLELRPDSKYWYGRYKVNGRRVCVSLQVPVEGKRPASLLVKGDQDFEISRVRADEALKRIIEQAHSTRDATRLVERLYELKTGESIRSTPLDDLPDAWIKVPRRRPINPRYAEQCRSALTRFVKFIRQQNPQATELANVTRKLATEFMETEAARGVTAKTWNDTLKLLRATCKHLLPLGSINPFHSIPTRDIDTIFRHPFSAEELKLIVAAAKADDFIQPIILTGICTAMRRGDCCLLRWKDVDLDKQFITVKTAKTGQTVSIPIFPMLYDALARRPHTHKEFVFPEQAAMYCENPDGITWRVKKVLAAAGFKDAEEEDEDSAKKKPDKDTMPVRGEIHVARTRGKRRASIRDFHSFRVTWVTLALTAGVPLEIVQKVTGHKTADIVLKHYFQPGREDFRKVLNNAMPTLLTNGHKTPAEKMKAIILSATPETSWKAISQLRKLVGQFAA